MNDFLAGIGVALFLEGLLWAAFPAVGIKLLALAAATGPDRMRLQGIVALLAGVVLVWIARS